MNQVAFNLSPPASPDPVDRALDALRRDPLGFCKVTEGWLRQNKALWRQFYDEAERQRRGGRRRGSKAIFEYLRYETPASDSDTAFKLNNSYASGLARLYNRVTGFDYFETREAA